MASLALLALFVVIIIVAVPTTILSAVILHRVDQVHGNTQGLIPRAQWVEGTCNTSTVVSEARRVQAYNHRVTTAYAQYVRPIPCHPNNGDDTLYTTRAASYSKGLPHDPVCGFVQPLAYGALLLAVSSGDPAAYDAIPMGWNPGPPGRRLDNPQAGNALGLEGGDSRSFSQPPAPKYASAEQAFEMAEDYWMALLRDVPFSSYGTDPTSIAAIADLNQFSHLIDHGITLNASSLFRGWGPGNMVGPYISQFLYMPIPFGANSVDQRMYPATANLDFMTNFSEWLHIQNGNIPTRVATFGSTSMFLRNGRDLAAWVHVDVLFQAYFMSMLGMFSMQVPFDPNIPYRSSGLNQRGFGTWGEPMLASLLGKVAEPALKAVWFQKWNVHRRARPEVLAQRVHNYKIGNPNCSTYAPHADLIGSAVLDQIRLHNTAQNGGGPDSYLLPMAFVEGSPLHPSYGAGHATVAGACVTILKAFLDESFILPNPVRPALNGTTLVPCGGSSSGSDDWPCPPPLTTGGELNKLAYNVALGRDFAGVHWRTDTDASLVLGEQVAIQLLRDIVGNYPEPFAGFSFTDFAGNAVFIPK